MTKFRTSPISGPIAFTAQLTRAAAGHFWPESLEWHGDAPVAKLLVNKGRKTERQEVAFNLAALSWEIAPNWTLVENDIQSAALVAALMDAFSQRFNDTMQQYVNAHKLARNASLPYAQQAPDLPPSRKDTAGVKDWRGQHQKWLSRVATMLSDDNSLQEAPELLETSETVLSRLVPALDGLPRPVLMDWSASPLIGAADDVIALSVQCPSNILHVPVSLEPLNATVRIAFDMGRPALAHAQDIAASHLAALVQVIALRWRKLGKPLALSAFRDDGDTASESLVSIWVEPEFWANGPEELARIDAADFRTLAPKGMRIDHHKREDIDA